LAVKSIVSASASFPLVPKLELGNKSGWWSLGTRVQVCSQAGAWEQEWMLELGNKVETDNVPLTLIAGKPAPTGHESLLKCRSQTARASGRRAAVGGSEVELLVSHAEPTVAPFNGRGGFRAHV